MVILYRKFGYILVFIISEIQIQMIIKIGTAKSTNAYLKAKYYFPYTTRILDLKLVFMEYAAPK